MHDTLPLLETIYFPAINRERPSTLQVNLGYRCNQSCVHCHVNAGPNRVEMMSMETMTLIPQVLMARGISTLDLTGGAPELHQGFRTLVMAARKKGVHVIDRCNLTILFEPGQDGLAEFLAEQEVEVIASLPCYSLTNVDRQRGSGVFDKSIEALQRLNSLGYGQHGTGLSLKLVYNPQGPVLPPDQSSLQADYKRELRQRFGIEFNELYALANMPIQRFGSMLVSKGQFQSYLTLLREQHREGNLAHVMCRNTISVDWTGHLYDCDFNQQLGISMRPEAWTNGRGSRPHLRDLIDHDPSGSPITVAGHCYGCTAGSGSSCGGSLQEAP